MILSMVYADPMFFHKMKERWNDGLRSFQMGVLQNKKPIDANLERVLPRIPTSVKNLTKIQRNLFKPQAGSRWENNWGDMSKSPTPGSKMQTLPGTPLHKRILQNLFASKNRKFVIMTSCS